MWETMVAVLIVGSALFFTGRKLTRLLASPEKSRIGCPGCSSRQDYIAGCPSGKTPGR